MALYAKEGNIMANEHNRLTVFSSQAYEGVEASSPIQLIYNKRDPQPHDKKNYLIGCLWVNTLKETVWESGKPGQ